MFLTDYFTIQLNVNAGVRFPKVLRKIDRPHLKNILDVESSGKSW